MPQLLSKPGLTGRYTNLRFAGIEVEGIIKRDDRIFKATNDNRDVWKGKKVLLTNEKM